MIEARRSLSLYTPDTAEQAEIIVPCDFHTPHNNAFTPKPHRIADHGISGGQRRGGANRNGAGGLFPIIPLFCKRKNRFGKSIQIF